MGGHATNQELFETFESQFLQSIGGGLGQIRDVELRQAIEILLLDIKGALETKKSCSFSSKAQNSINLQNLIQGLESDAPESIPRILEQLSFISLRDKTYAWLFDKPEMMSEWSKGNRQISRWLDNEYDFKMFGCWFIDSTHPHSITPYVRSTSDIDDNSLEVLAELFYLLPRRPVAQLPRRHATPQLGWVYCELCWDEATPGKRFCAEHSKRSTDRTRREIKLRKLAQRILDQTDPWFRQIDSRKHFDVSMVREAVWVKLTKKWRDKVNRFKILGRWDDHSKIRQLVDRFEICGGKVDPQYASFLRSNGLSYPEIGSFFDCSRQAVHQALTKGKESQLRHPQKYVQSDPPSSSNRTPLLS